jgi:carboxyl-terminal processing protease
MPSQRRQRSLVALAAGLAVLVAGIWLGEHPDDLPAFARGPFASDRSTRVVDEAIERISSDYYRPVTEGRLSDASIAAAVASLGDRFSHYLSPNEFREFNSPPHFTGIGVDVTGDTRGSSILRHGLVIVRVFDFTPAARVGLMPGELIVAANGGKLEGLSEAQAAALIKGPPGTNVTLMVQAHPGPHPQHGATRTVRITRATVSEPVVATETHTVHGVKLGVVALATFSPGAHGEVRDGVEHELRMGARGIVLDLRDNGGGLVEEAQLIASIFIPKGTIVTTRGRTQPTGTLTAVGGAISPSIPVVVLVDANTASASEIVTAALQDHRRATVVGIHTFGKGVFQEEEPLSNGGALDITVGEYFTPNGRNLGGGGIKQGAGITPEVLVLHGVDTPLGLAAALRTLAAKVAAAKVAAAKPK